MRKKDQDEALFWCTLLHPVLFGEVPAERVHAFLRQLATEERRFPDGTLRKPPLSTLKRKLRTFRQGGFEALARKRRRDRGKPRAHDPAIVEKAVALKRDQPRRSHVTLNTFLSSLFAKTLPRSTLYRYLKAAGATRLKLGIVKTPVRRRWTRDHTHALWLGDFEDGPCVLHQGLVLPTYLSAFLDCHSRWLVEGRYYLRQNLDVLIDSFLRALATHGAPGELYVDQAKIYQSRALKAACYTEVPRPTRA